MNAKDLIVDCAIRLLASPLIQAAWPAKTLLESRGNAFAGKKFFLVRRQGFGMGLFSYFWTNVGWINYAESRGMIPVIDMETNKTIYHSENGDKHENAWEFFFHQPCGYGLGDIETAHAVFIPSTPVPPVWSMPRLGACENVERNPTLAHWRDVTSRNIKLKMDNVSAFGIPQLEEAIPHGVIGILARGTDYVKLRPAAHPVQPTADMIIKATERYSSNGHADERIFLVTEDKSIADKIIARFGSRVILSNQSFIEYSGGLIGKQKDVAASKERGLRYLRAILDLSRCSALIAGRTSGTVGAVLLSSGFKYTKIFNLGNYP